MKYVHTLGSLSTRRIAQPTSHRPRIRPLSILPSQVPYLLCSPLSRHVKGPRHPSGSCRTPRPVRPSMCASELNHPAGYPVFHPPWPLPTALLMSLCSLIDTHHHTELVAPGAIPSRSTCFVFPRPKCSRGRKGGKEERGEGFSLFPILL
ncbi:hypothetical protein GGR56DRAFT_655787 [Xylariaceae sp. FL0804]|nr:hypothetical protein GGR56DRAFT_655787 [Xylariaceae sp. FL0804]